MNKSPECSCVAVAQGHEDHLIPYSVVQPVHIQKKRPVIFSPSILSRGLIERLLQPAESALMYDTCSPGKWTAITLYIQQDSEKYNRTKEFFHQLPSDTKQNMLSVVCRAYCGFRDTRQDSVPARFLQSRPHSRHTPAGDRGGY